MLLSNLMSIYTYSASHLKPLQWEALGGPMRLVAAVLGRTLQAIQIVGNPLLNSSQDVILCRFMMILLKQK